MLVSLSKEDLTFHLNDKLSPLVQLKFTGVSPGNCGDVDEIVAHIRYLTLLHYSVNFPMTQLANSFDIQAEQSRLQALSVQDQVPESTLTFAILPDSRVDSAMRTLYPKLQSGDTISNGQCGGLAKAYIDMCDFFVVDVSDQVVWYIDFVYGGRQSKQFSLNDIPDLDSGYIHIFLAFLC